VSHFRAIRGADDSQPWPNPGWAAPLPASSATPLAYEISHSRPLICMLDSVLKELPIQFAVGERLGAGPLRHLSALALRTSTARRRVACSP
jgi:hypothetical protein